MDASASISTPQGQVEVARSNHFTVLIFLRHWYLWSKIESDHSLIPWPSYHQESRLQNRSGSTMAGFHME
jgi:hypothetical protein